RAPPGARGRALRRSGGGGGRERRQRAAGRAPGRPRPARPGRRALRAEDRGERRPRRRDRRRAVRRRSVRGADSPPIDPLRPDPPQGRVSGLLYLENNLTPAAFTADRLEIIRILAAEAAISLENARLYEEMKQEVERRRRAEEDVRSALAEV